MDQSGELNHCVESQRVSRGLQTSTEGNRVSSTVRLLYNFREHGSVVFWCDRGTGRLPRLGYGREINSDQ